MIVDLIDPSLKLILLDIEGTTTPIDFVYKTLFPFARERVKDYLSRNWENSDVQNDLAQLRAEQIADVSQGFEPPALETGAFSQQLESVVAYIHWLMDRDRKSTPLKSIQGRIWQEGYAESALFSQVFDDVPPALARWRRQNKLICIYSSGSALAQKLLFGHTTAGDLTRYISRYFDTTIGYKVEIESYRRIARELQLTAAEIIFVSDVVAELDAARSAGLKTILAMRPGARPIEAPMTHPVITSFDEL